MANNESTNYITQTPPLHRHKGASLSKLNKQTNIQTKTLNMTQISNKQHIFSVQIAQTLKNTQHTPFYLLTLGDISEEFLACREPAFTFLNTKTYFFRQSLTFPENGVHMYVDTEAD